MRIKTTSGDANAPRIDPIDVAQFFAIRAEKARELGSVRAVIYQDKHPDLAERRDAAEKAVLLPLLDLQPEDRVLDIACGTGRWTGEVAPKVAHYHGTDFAQGLVELAREAHGQRPNVQFSVMPSEEISLGALGESDGFGKILVLGLLIYLNEESVQETLECIARVAADNCMILIREPVAIEHRLTVKEHFSDDLDQAYNAIYRTDDELRSFFETTICRNRFVLCASDALYASADLNNRSDTHQRWYKYERSKS
jgi:SAM-dependent methyltransferase